MFPHIHTARLYLRPYTPDDLDALHRLWTDPNVRRYLFDNEVIARGFVAHEIKETRASFEKDGFGQWAITLKDREAMIGFAGYRFFLDPPELQLLYGLDPSCWGQGYATEVAHALLRYGFETLGFDHVLACADVPNTASLRVMERAGMTYQKRCLIDGLDTIYYIIEQQDYTLDRAPYLVAFED